MNEMEARHALAWRGLYLADLVTMPLETLSDTIRNNYEYPRLIEGPPCLTEDLWGRLVSRHYLRLYLQIGRAHV